MFEEIGGCDRVGGLGMVPTESLYKINLLGTLGTDYAKEMFHVNGLPDDLRSTDACQLASSTCPASIPPSRDCIHLD